MKVKSPEVKAPKSDIIKKVPARNRIKYSAGQLRSLEKVFMSTQYPDSSILEDLAKSLNIDTDRLSIWFQNRRSKFKRQSKDRHVSWMRQQLYQQGAAPQPQVAKNPGGKDTCHVLSPPDAVLIKRDDSKDKPRSNLHYLPGATTDFNYSRLLDYDPAYSLMYPPQSNIYSALNDAVSAVDSQSQLQLSHIMNEVSYPQSSTSTFPAQPTGYSASQPALTSTGSSYYQNYGPYYNFPNAQLSFPQIV